MAGKHDEFDDFFGDDDDTPIVDTRADGRLYRVPLGRLAANLVNPRTDFGTEDQLIDLGKSLGRRQNQSCPVVSRNAYLKLWPDHADRIGDVDYVLVSGERRYRAATVVGLPSLDCVVNDAFAADRRTFMEAVVSENVDRQNFDPIEEAYAVQALVREFGTNRAVAQHFERVDGWVTQRILLTHLAPGMQQLVRDKRLPLEAARKLGKLARDNAWGEGEQERWWQEEQETRVAAAQARAEDKRTDRTARAAPTAPALPEPAPVPAVPRTTEPTAQPESFTAVKHEPEPAPQAGDHVVVLPDVAVQSDPPPNQTRPELRQATQVVPDPRPSEPAPNESDAEQPRRFPYEDPLAATRHLILKMPTGVLEATIRLLIEHAEERGLNVAQQRTS